MKIRNPFREIKPVIKATIKTTKGDIIIRNATKKDIKGIAKLWVAMSEQHANYDDYFKLSGIAKNSFKKFIKTRIGKKESIFLVAVKDEVIVGFIHAEKKERPPVFENRKEYDIFDIAVDEKYRGLKIGKKLIEQLPNGYIISLTVAERNKKAIKFYKNLDFKIVMHQMYMVK